MTGLAFADTNILLYMYDSREPLKQAKAATAFREHWSAGTLVISTQVIQEFYSVAIGKLALHASRAREIVSDLCELRVVTVTTEVILRATEIAPRLKLSFWDALIISAAEAAGASLLLTEDLSHGHSYLGIRAHNPFR